MKDYITSKVVRIAFSILILVLHYRGGRNMEASYIGGKRVYLLTLKILNEETVSDAEARSERN